MKECFELPSPSRISRQSWDEFLLSICFILSLFINGLLLEISIGARGRFTSLIEVQTFIEMGVAVRAWDIVERALELYTY